MTQKKLFLYLSISDLEVDTLHRILSKTDNSLLNEGINYLDRLENLSDVNLTNRLNEETVDSVQSELSEAFQKSGSEEIHTYILIDQVLKNYLTPNIAARFHKMVLESFSLDLELIFFLKRQDFFLETSFSNMILNNNNNSSNSFDEYLDRFEKSDLDWYKLLDSYSETFGKENMQVHEFKKSHFIEKRDFVRHVGSLAGSKYLENYMGLISENKFSINALGNIRLANHHMNEGEWEKLEKIFEDTTHTENNNSFFTAQQRSNFLNKYDDSNAKIAEEYVNVEGFFTSSNKKKINEDDEEQLTESLTVAFTKAALDLKNRTDKLLNEQKKKHPLEKTLLNILNGIRSILKK